MSITPDFKNAGILNLYDKAYRGHTICFDGKEWGMETKRVVRNKKDFIGDKNGQKTIFQLILDCDQRILEYWCDDEKLYTIELLENQDTWFPCAKLYCSRGKQTCSFVW